VSAVPAGVRLDKWLWAARFVKTRSLAVQAIDSGHVQVNGQAAKAARDLHPGDLVRINLQGQVREVRVVALSSLRGPAPVAQALYAETEQSLASRAAAAEARRLGVEPALAQAEGRPTKRDRRQLVEWQRWSASLD